MQFPTRLVSIAACASALCLSQGVKRTDLAPILNFEIEQSGTAPTGWGGGPPETIFTDNKVVHGGKWAARLERDAASSNKFSTITIGIPIDFTGKRIELRGFLKTEEVSGYVGLWMREDAEGESVAFDNMQGRKIKGTNDWTEYSINLPLRPEARQLYIGALLGGTGKLWVDDLQLLIDGKPVWELPKVEPPKTAIDLDHEFDKGSGIALTELSKTQIDNLATLGKVWGFLKYHHAAIASGGRHWDYDLFRVLPQVLAAPDRATANAAIYKWEAALGTLVACSACTQLPTDLHLKPGSGWISDEKQLGAALSQSLQYILRERLATFKNSYYVSLAPGVGNPVFDHEPAYRNVKFPDAGYQILALYRYWNMIQYWFPYRDVIGESWYGVLTEFIPRVALAKTFEIYQTQMMDLIARVHDTHANLWSAMHLVPPAGQCEVPVMVRFVENSAVITQSDAATELKTGDVIQDLDGTPVKDLVERWRPHYAASNEPTRLRDIANHLTRGACGPATLRIRRDQQTVNVTTLRIAPAAFTRITHDLPGETFRKLSPDIAYMKLSSIKVADVKRYIDSAQDTRGLIIDIRNYPSEFVVFALGSLLVDKPTEFVRFTTGDLTNPGAFHWGTSLSITPALPHYKGKVVILVDEVSQSQAEYTAMALRSAPGAIVVGSTTAGADGNVSSINLLGGLRTMISGIGVFYPDKRPTQRVGIIPDIEAKPTVAGIRAGRDEVLEAALRQILGAAVPQSEIETLARHE